MPEDNPNLDIPLEEEKISGTDGKSELSLEEIEAEINRRNEVKKFKDKPEKDPNVVDPLEIDPKDKPPVEEVIETQADPRFKGKTLDEMLEIYKNLEIIQKSQTDELGTLRQENKDFKEQEVKNKNLNLEEIEKKIMPEVLSWSVEKRTEWFEWFNREPEKAMASVVKVVIKPLTRSRAIDSNTNEVKRLMKDHKDDVVPYIGKEVNALIAANENWWKEYGTGVFEHAYGEFRNKNFDKYAAIRAKNITTKENEKVAEEEKNKIQTFVEGQHPTKIIQKAKEITHQQIKDAEPEESMATIRAELLRRGVKVDD